MPMADVVPEIELNVLFLNKKSKHIY